MTKDLSICRNSRKHTNNVRSYQLGSEKQNHIRSIKDTLSFDLGSLKVFKYLPNKCKHKERRAQSIRVSQV